MLRFVFLSWQPATHIWKDSLESFYCEIFVDHSRFLQFSKKSLMKNAFKIMLNGYLEYNSNGLIDYLLISS